MLPILYVESVQGVADIVARGFDAPTVKRVIAMVDRTATSSSAGRAPSASRSRRAPSARTGASQ